MRTILLPLSLAGVLSAAPIPLVNPSGEINPGVNFNPISDPEVIGWESDGGQLIRGGIDYGNGAWRLSFEDSEEIRQMTSHVIQAGASYSLRFDAAMFATGSSGDTLILIGNGLRNGDFNSDNSGIDSRTFEDTPDWINLGGAQTLEACRTTLDVDGTRNAVVAQTGTRVFGGDTGHTLAIGELFRATYQWRDALDWNDANDRIGVTLFTTDDDTLTGSRTVIQTLLSTTSSVNSTYQPETANFAAIPAWAAGKRLFVSLEGVDGNADGIGFARFDNFVLQRVTSQDPVPPIDPASRVIIADLYVDDNGTPLPVATRSRLFKSTTVGSWAHYHLAVPAGTLDAHAGKTLGVRFRSNNSAFGNMQSVDHVRLDFWPAAAPDGSFAASWNTTPNQVWTGPGTWANRLQDWQVAGSRVNCINGAKNRRTMHRTGTSIRGDGSNFTLSVRAGVHAGTNNNAARSGFLLGAGPNLDWRGALLVHHAIGRDCGLFLGLRGDGAAVIEDLSGSTVTTLNAGTAAGFVEDSRLVLIATYVPASGNYQLALEVRNSADVLISSATATITSDRMLGSFGLMSHRGGGDTRFWFDDFSGSGAALNPEPDRSLVIMGAMHTLSRGTLKLSAQLPPISLSGNPQVFLDTWNGISWQQIASSPIDNTDNVSSYTATFKIPNWNDDVDTDYRVRINLDGTDHTWTGTIRRDPVDQKKIVIATTNCQQLTDGHVEATTVDWSPVVIWHPHALAFTHVAKHQPDVHFAAGDQLYESRPTPVDNSNNFNRQHDYLYKWYLWMLQSRELARSVPTIAIPDDHEVFHGNLWGEGGVATSDENTGGYRWPASWVKMVERTHTSHLPDPDPYNAVQPAPSVAQGIGVYFTGMVYGRVGIAVLEDRKFKTGRTNPPADLNQQYLLGDRQHDFLRAWNVDWAGQDLKLVASQSPLGNVRTHASEGFNFNLNDQDTHGWPVHRRNEAWELLRASRMFQLAGDQHLGLVAHHGVGSPRDAGFSFTAPAISNFFPRIWDPVHNTSGTTTTVSPYKGDFFFNGVGTLPDGVTPNLSANFPAHVAILAAANGAMYYNQTLGIHPPDLHDTAPGYGITRIDKSTRRITFEAWPLYAYPGFPQTGSQYPDWPITMAQTDNDGRTPTGYLTTTDTQSQKNAVIRVYDESDNSLLYAMRIRGNLFRPPVYDNSKTYRIALSFDDGAVSEIYENLSATAPGAPAIHSFTALQPSVVAGTTSTLRWDVSGPATLAIDQGIGDVMAYTVDGIGFLEVSPAAGTTYTLTLNDTLTAATTVRVFPDRESWNTLYFNPAELRDPNLSGGDKDPDGDGFTNDEEFLFGTSPVTGNGALVTTAASGGDLVLRWLQRERGASYKLKQSNSLVNGAWTAIGALCHTTDDKRFIYQMKIHFADGTSQTLISDETWRALPAGNTAVTDQGNISAYYYRAPREGIDARHFPFGWDKTGFDDASWQAADVDDPITNLTESATLNTRQYSHAPASVVKKAEGHYYSDFGKARVAGLRLELDGTSGRQVEIRLGEELEAPQTVRHKMRTGNTYQETWTLKDGPQTLQNWGYRVFRHVELLNVPEPFDASRIRALELRQPFDDDASSFESSAPMLNAVWDLCKYTIKALSLDMYVDTHTRERLNYEGGIFTEQISDYTVQGEYAFPRFSIEHPYHRPTWPTEGKQNSVMMAKLDYLYTGNTSSLRKHYDILKTKNLEPFINADFLVEKAVDAGGQHGTYGKDMVDWPISELDGFQFTPINTVINAFNYQAIADLAEIARVLGEKEDAARYAELAQKLRHAINTHLFDSVAGKYKDGKDATNHSIHANAIPMSLGMVDPAHQQSVADFIASRGMVGSVYLAQFLLDGLYQSHRADAALKIMTSNGLRSWGNMIHKLDATLTGEAWDPSIKRNMSFSHPWATAPANVIPRGMFGIVPLEPGFSRFQVKHQPGSLQWAKLTTPSIKGPIRVGFASGEAHFEMLVTVPVNTQATIHLPVTPDARVSMNGHQVEGVVHQGFIMIESVGSGTHSFRVDREK